MNCKYYDEFCAFVTDIIEKRTFIDPRLQTNINYQTIDYVKGIFNFLRNSTYWTRCRNNDTVTYKIDGTYLNEIHKFISDLSVKKTS